MEKEINKKKGGRSRFLLWEIWLAILCFDSDCNHVVVCKNELLVFNIFLTVAVRGKTEGHRGAEFAGTTSRQAAWC